ncbi:hypothetical protein DPMN_147372 [Dreissena polymorpha]|uniref:Uncharacterized protein n=1 Tax=Dreissena polymorpha TaxID=45954 RepID=A0A9D4J0K6_DREPO|nr:hypothetical protein DPMN_147372 [Dreissena polymorpha]
MVRLAGNIIEPRHAEYGLKPWAARPASGSASLPANDVAKYCLLYGARLIYCQDCAVSQVIWSYAGSI